MQIAEDVRLIRDADRAIAVLHPLRQRILGQLRQPDSAAGLARRLSLPRQRLNYHLRELEKEGLVELVEERVRGNCRERVLRAVARSYLISPEVLGELATDPEQVRDRFSAAYLVATAARAIRDLSLLRSRAEGAKKRLATFTLQTQICFATSEERSAFAEELANEIARLTAKYHAGPATDGRHFNMLVGIYPAIKEHPTQESET